MQIRTRVRGSQSSVSGRPQVRVRWAAEVRPGFLLAGFSRSRRRSAFGARVMQAAHVNINRSLWYRNAEIPAQISAQI